MRATVGCTLVAVLTLGSGLAAEEKKDDKIDAKKLIGKWESKEFKEKGVSKVAEFAKDGKAVFTDSVNGNETKVEGMRWVAVSHVFGLGSTYANQLCH